MVVDCRKCEGRGNIPDCHNCLRSELNCCDKCEDAEEYFAKEICPRCFGAGKWKTLYSVERRLKESDEFWHAEVVDSKEGAMALVKENKELWSGHHIRVSVHSHNVWNDKRSGH